MLCAILALSACTPGILGNDDSSADSTIPVTSPDGFKDVTAPPEQSDTVKDTENNDKDTAAKDTTAQDTTEKTSSSVSTPDEAVAKARAYKGEVDSRTGYKLAYSYDGMMNDNGTEYYKIRVSWFIEEEERYSKCGYILVSPDGNCVEYDW